VPARAQYISSEHWGGGGAYDRNCRTAHLPILS
jgi:hypothetical protein